MAEDKLAKSLQQSVLAALCLDQEHGQLIAAQVTHEYFDSVYRDFAMRLLAYRRKYKVKPSEADLQDIVARSAMGRDNTDVVKRLVNAIVDDAASLNAAYAAARLEEFKREQTIKGALSQAIERYGQKDESSLDDIEKIFADTLKSRNETFNRGMFLGSPESFAAMRAGEKRQSIPLGIDLLDKLGIGPHYKELLLYIGAKGTGKTWFCVHVGKQAIRKNLNVVHISCEMSEDEVMSRYHQSLWGIAADREAYTQMTVKYDGILKNKAIGMDKERVKPKLKETLEFPNIVEIAKSKYIRAGSRLGRLVVKQFPTSRLTVDQVDGYLDFLDSEEGFVPNVLMVDYPKLMHHRTGPRDDLRIGLGRTMEELRGIAVARNLALVCPHQGTRQAMGARRVRSKDASEDISVVQTADTVFAFSQTEDEKRFNLGRLSVEHTRNARDKMIIMLTQAYSRGQYVLDSFYHEGQPWLEKLIGSDLDPE